MTIYSAVLIGCQRVTDRRTDRQTDVQPISITCFSIADARKNDKISDIILQDEENVGPNSFINADDNKTTRNRRSGT